MNLKRLYHKLFCVMQWNVGFAKGNIADVIKDKKNNLSFKWFKITNPKKSFADPFIFKSPDGKVKVLFEEFSMIDLADYGKIISCEVDTDLSAGVEREILDKKRHVSYPFTFSENGKTYIIPENREGGKLVCYEFDFENNRLINERVIIDDLPLLDATVLMHNGRYWIFATLGDRKFDHSRLYIYCADSLFGPYKAHTKNPVKQGLNGTRPAGNIITVNEELYRPAQNCSIHYGESITINKITQLTVNEFSEEFYCTLSADKKSEYPDGIHTINALENIIVVDGIKMMFKPFTKLGLFIKKRI